MKLTAEIRLEPVYVDEAHWERIQRATARILLSGMTKRVYAAMEEKHLKPDLHARAVAMVIGLEAYLELLAKLPMAFFFLDPPGQNLGWRRVWELVKGGERDVLHLAGACLPETSETEIIPPI